MNSQEDIPAWFSSASGTGTDATLLAKTLPGLEEVLAQEIQSLGGKDVQPIKRGVHFTGDLGFVYKANLWLRTAVRILVEIKRFKVRNEKELYRKVYAMPWEAFFDVDKTLSIDATVFSQKFTNSLFIAQKCKDAIADRFRDQCGDRPSIDTKNPDIRINVYISRENVVVSLDSSGPSLHKRGYRSEVNEAPINEVLAAGIISLSGWNKRQPLIDPMCGSGTFLIEAALMATNQPPNLQRDSFSFKHWKTFDSELFDLIAGKAKEKSQPLNAEILGFDNDIGVLWKARENIERAGFEELIKTDHADFTQFRKEVPEGAMLIFNPPYGVKIKADIPALYRAISDTLKKRFAGSSAWIFTSSMEGIKSVALRHSKKIALPNSTLDAWMVRFDMYAGTKRGDASPSNNKEETDN